MQTHLYNTAFIVHVCLLLSTQNREIRAGNFPEDLISTKKITGFITKTKEMWITDIITIMSV